MRFIHVHVAQPGTVVMTDASCRSARIPAVLNRHHYLRKSRFMPLFENATKSCEYERELDRYNRNIRRAGFQ